LDVLIFNIQIILYEFYQALLKYLSIFCAGYLYVLICVDDLVQDFIVESTIIVVLYIISFGFWLINNYNYLLFLLVLSLFLLMIFIIAYRRSKIRTDGSRVKGPFDYLNQDTNLNEVRDKLQHGEDIYQREKPHYNKYDKHGQRKPPRLNKKTLKIVPVTLNYEDVNDHNVNDKIISFLPTSPFFLKTSKDPKTDNDNDNELNETISKLKESARAASLFIPLRHKKNYISNNNLDNNIPTNMTSPMLLPPIRGLGTIRSRLQHKFNLQTFQSSNNKNNYEPIYHEPGNREDNKNIKTYSSEKTITTDKTGNITNLDNNIDINQLRNQLRNQDDIMISNEINKTTEDLVLLINKDSKIRQVKSSKKHTHERKRSPDNRRKNSHELNENIVERDKKERKRDKKRISSRRRKESDRPPIHSNFNLEKTDTDIDMNFNPFNAEEGDNYPHISNRHHGRNSIRIRKERNEKFPGGSSSKINNNSININYYNNKLEYDNDQELYDSLEERDNEDELENNFNITSYITSRMRSSKRHDINGDQYYLSRQLHGPGESNQAEDTIIDSVDVIPLRKKGYVDGANDHNDLSICKYLDPQRPTIGAYANRPIDLHIDKNRREGDVKDEDIRVVIKPKSTSNNQSRNISTRPLSHSNIKLNKQNNSKTIRPLSSNNNLTGKYNGNIAGNGKKREIYEGNKFVNTDIPNHKLINENEIKPKQNAYITQRQLLRSAPLHRDKSINFTAPLKIVESEQYNTSKQTNNITTTTHYTQEGTMPLPGSKLNEKDKDYEPKYPLII
jgi:hypothetical protein